MKKLIHIFNIISLLSFISFTKENTCNENQIRISALGKCKDISDILENNNLSLKIENLFYLSTNKEGKIEKNGYKLDIFKLNDTKLQSHNMRKSKLYIPESCLDKMATKIHLDKNKGIVIIVQDSNNMNSNNITDNYFIILYNNGNGVTQYISSKEYDFSFCNEDPIFYDDEVQIKNLRYNYNNKPPMNVTKISNKISEVSDKGIDLFDPNSNFLNDICFKFTSDKGYDVTLESRVEDYYQNITFCDDREGSHYISCNYSIKNEIEILTYRCAYGFYKSNEDKSSFINKLDSELKSLVSVSNLKVITCYKQFLNLRDIIRNYGGIMCILVLIIQIICFLIFCFSGIKPIKEKIRLLLKSGKEILRQIAKHGVQIDMGPENDKDKSDEQKPKKIFNLWGPITDYLRNKKILKLKSKDQKIDEIKLNVANPPKYMNSSSSHRGINKESEDMNIKMMDINNEDILNNKQSSINKANANPIQQKTEGTIIENSHHTNSDPFTNSKTIKRQNKVNEPYIKSDASQLYEYEGDELNELPFDKAINVDKRNFCQYYGNILLISHIILNVFFRYNDYNLFTVKFGLFLMTFPINLTFNILFFTNDNIALIYVRSMTDLSMFWENLKNSFYSSILSTTSLIILKFISDTHIMVRSLRKIKDMDEAKDKTHCILRCIKLRIIIYYIISFIFLLVFGFYILSFCAIFENTQVALIRSTFTSWLFSLIYPFIICFITSILRSCSFLLKSKCLYFVKQMMQFF